MLEKLPRVAALALLASGATAQETSLTATIVHDLGVRALFSWGFFVEDIEPVGPFPAGGVELAAYADRGAAAMAASELEGLAAGVTGFRWSTGGAGGLYQGEYGGYAAFGGIQLLLTQPKRTPVLVVVEGNADSQGDGSTVTTVDVDGDQVVDLWLDGGRARVEHGLLVGPEGAAIELYHGSGGSWGGATSELTLTAYPGNAPLASYGTSCLPLTWSRGPTGAATLSCPAPSDSLVAFFFGTKELCMRLPSGCFLLTNPGRRVLVRPSGGAATLALRDLAPPTGVEFRMQAMVIAASGRVQTTNGLVMTGP